jgi:hypothetical protein
MIRPDDIRELLRKEPFQPFRIHLSNGQTYDVTHPELGYVMRATMIVSRPATDVPYMIGDGFHVLSILHINNIEILTNPASAKTGNGTVGGA